MCVYIYICICAHVSSRSLLLTSEEARKLSFRGCVIGLWGGLVPQGDEGGQDAVWCLSGFRVYRGDIRVGMIRSSVTM